MAESIGISRNTLRDAIRVLARQGLVTHTMHRGAVVTTLSEEDVADLFRVRRAPRAAGDRGHGPVPTKERLGRARRGGADDSPGPPRTTTGAA